MQREHWEYGIFNDITTDEARKLSEVDRWYLEQIGPSYLYPQDAIDKMVEFNWLRQQARDAEGSDVRFVVEVDRLVGRPVNIKIMRQRIIWNGWEPLH